MLYKKNNCCCLCRRSLRHHPNSCRKRTRTAHRMAGSLDVWRVEYLSMFLLFVMAAPTTQANLHPYQQDHCLARRMLSPTRTRNPPSRSYSCTHNHRISTLWLQSHSQKGELGRAFSSPEVIHQCHWSLKRQLNAYQESSCKRLRVSWIVEMSVRALARR